MFVNLLILLGGCVDQSLSKGSFDPEAADNGTEDTSFVAPEDTGPETVPAFYAVSATLTVLAGLPTTDGAEVTLEVVDADLQRTDCTVPLDTTGIVAGTSSAGVPLWWELPVVADDACATLPESISLGIGTLDADVRARLGTVDHEDVADSLYGAYLRVEGGEVWAFGYAGTDADLAGDAPAEDPPGDGTYALAPLYLAELPEQTEE
jgi:hypothetical protein